MRGEYKVLLGRVHASPAGSLARLADLDLGRAYSGRASAFMNTNNVTLAGNRFRRVNAELSSPHRAILDLAESGFRLVVANIKCFALSVPTSKPNSCAAPLTKWDETKDRQRPEDKAVASPGVFLLARY